MNWIKNTIFKKFLLDFIIKGLDELLKKIPGNNRKTITGIVIAVASLFVSEFPQIEPYGRPILDWLLSQPYVAVAGFALSGVGAIHKLIKAIRAYFEKKEQPDRTKELEDLSKAITEAITEK